MARLILSLDGQMMAEYNMNKERYTVGRLPDNDIRIDNAAVSGHHSLIINILNDSFLEDLNSTNGTYVNGKAVKKQVLQNGDTIEVGKYKIKFVSENEAPGYDKTMVFKPGETPVAAAAGEVVNGSLRVLSGTASGREVPLTKVVTTVGKPGVAVASITRRQNGFVVAHVEGAETPLLNGAPISSEPVALKSGDVIELAGTKMQFIQN